MVLRSTGDILVLPWVDFEFDPPGYNARWAPEGALRGKHQRFPVREWGFCSSDDDELVVGARRRRPSFGRKSFSPVSETSFRDQVMVSDDSGYGECSTRETNSRRSVDDNVVCVDSESARGSDNINDDIDSVWISRLHLTNADKRELLSGEMLTDKHILAAQKLLSSQQPRLGGLQDPILSQVGFEAVRTQSVQIHHTRGHHWVVSSWTPGDVVHVYDTLYDFVSDDLLDQLEEIYVAAPRRVDGRLLYDMPAVQKQTGSRDCGLFAIALATELCIGSDITGVRFDQTRMREHLYRCLRRQRMEPFPAEYIVL